MKALKMSLALICAAFSTTVTANVPVEEGGEGGGIWCCHYRGTVVTSSGSTDVYYCHWR